MPMHFARTVAAWGVRGTSTVIRKPIKIALISVLALGTVLTPTAFAQTIVVHNDGGGRVDQRANLIRRLQAQRAEVKLQGNYCMSACTMYLALPNVCVDPRTKFGFHGPSSATKGLGLSPASFEKWSRVMGNHYPEPIRSWYMREGRTITAGFYEFKGRDLINMGVKQC